MRSGEKGKGAANIFDFGFAILDWGKGRGETRIARIIAKQT
jgi:hypothetical protein